MRKISKRVKKVWGKSQLNKCYGVYVKHKPKYDNTTFERFLELNIFMNQTDIERLHYNARTNKNSH